MNTLQAIVLAIIEGITEFLPVSSTGHMIVASSFFGIAQDDFTKLFTIVIQLGTILSVIVLYFKRFFQSLDFYYKLVVAFVPAVLFGLLFSDFIDGLLENQPVFIEDKLTNTVFDLKNGNYAFASEAGTFNNRFVLRFKDKTLGITDFDDVANKVIVSVKNKQIKINSITESIDKLKVYDLLGKQIYKKEKASSQEVLISNLTAKNQVLIVKTTLQSGKTVTDKIVY
jgi:hypothetical protein